MSSERIFWNATDFFFYSTIDNLMILIHNKTVTSCLFHQNSKNAKNLRQAVIKNTL